MKCKVDLIQLYCSQDNDYFRNSYIFSTCFIQWKRSQSCLVWIGQFKHIRWDTAAKEKQIYFNQLYIVYKLHLQVCESQLGPDEIQEFVRRGPLPPLPPRSVGLSLPGTHARPLARRLLWLILGKPSLQGRGQLRDAYKVALSKGRLTAHTTVSDCKYNALFGDEAENTANKYHSNKI